MLDRAPPMMGGQGGLNGYSLNHTDMGRRADFELRRVLQSLAQDRLHQLRRAGRPDRHDAPHRGRREEMDRGVAVPARAELLHAAARARGAETCDLYRLAAAWRPR